MAAKGIRISATDENGAEQDIGMIGDAAKTSEQNFGALQFPSTISLADSNATTADAEVLATLNDSQPYNMLTIVVSAFTATALNITASQDGTNFGIVLPSKDNENTAGAAIAAVGTYHLFGSYNSVIMTQSCAGGETDQWRQWTK